MDFLNKYEVVSTWDTQTDSCHITFPKNITAKDATGQPLPMYGANVNIGADTMPLFLRGDKITLTAGYYYIDASGSQIKNISTIFDGYISKVHSSIPITLDCEDAMFILKQIPAIDKVWANGVSMQSVINELLKADTTGKVAAANIRVATLSNTSIQFETGTFYTKTETISQVLNRINRNFGLFNYMKRVMFPDKTIGWELRIGYPTYYPSDIQNPNLPYKFIFQKNIISSNMEYMRKDDVTVSAVVQSLYSQTLNEQNDAGENKTKQQKLEVFVYNDPKTQALVAKEIKQPSDIPPNDRGERFSWYFPMDNTIAQLKNDGLNLLAKYYYTGFRGSFTTFGIPFIPFGDNIIIEDPIIPDRNGKYKVKSVKYSGGDGIGLRQEIHLDYLIQN